MPLNTEESEEKEKLLTQVKEEQLKDFMIQFLLVWNLNSDKYAQESYTHVLEWRKHSVYWFCFEGPSLSWNKFVMCHLLFPWMSAVFLRPGLVQWMCCMAMHTQIQSVGFSCVHLPCMFFIKKGLNQRTNLYQHIWHLHRCVRHVTSITCVPVVSLGMFLIYGDWVLVTS